MHKNFLNKHKIKIILFIIPVIFFLICLITLNDYGISWDEPIHFARGQAYFHFLTSGKTDYSDLKGKKSYFQNSSLTGAYFLDNDSAHPPTNDIFAALFNYVFYQKLNLVGDIQAYHLFNIFVSFLLVILLSVFAYQAYGLPAALISGFTLASYPLFFAESHFNIKDPSETLFFSLSIWFFWMSLKKFDWRWLSLFAISCGLALGIKFNIIFLPFVIFPYFLIRFWPQIKNKKFSIKEIPFPYKAILLFTPLIMIFLLILFWPFLWQNPIQGIRDSFMYYKEIGLGINTQRRILLPGGFNAFSIVWIFFTTPPSVLFLVTTGILLIIFGKKSKEKTEILWLLWFFVPICRVFLPNTSIYGGVRQIMEFLPGMALLAGFAGQKIFEYLKKTFHLNNLFISIVFVFFAILHVLALVKIHPNENVYFNSLIGGLKGAQTNNMPFWGNSFGNAYLQAVNWLNKNSEPNSKLALIQGTMTNIPKIQLRPDIDFSNSHWSGIGRKGEYLLELTHDDPVKFYPYGWDYVGKFLEPVYEVKVEGVAIAKIWKNDILHTKADMKKSEVKYLGKIDLTITDNQFTIDLGKEQNVSRIIVRHARQKDCSSTAGFMETKKEKGEWVKEKEIIPFPQVDAGVEDYKFTYYFPGRIFSKARFTSTATNSCVLINPKVEVYILE